MRKVWIAVAVSLALTMGCSKVSLSFQKNKAGTRSVILAGNSAAETVPVNPNAFVEESSYGLAGSTTIPPEQKASGEPVEIKEKLFIAQTNDVYLNPETYMGKTIKLEGLFKTQAYLGTDTDYHFVLRYGPGCCGNDGSAGFEVAWATSDQSYPQEDDWVAVVGVLDSYEEDGYPYLYLSLASLKVLEIRGAEFVSQ
ncbi:MAG: hypothetical protein LBT13_02950 [Treponema sp.]|jgi:uncharacterized membrane protein YcgQ (UPF0703/DUF1980 family)|nr:hypothetical protein [Treponema sp.]